MPFALIFMQLPNERNFMRQSTLHARCTPEGCVRIISKTYNSIKLTRKLPSSANVDYIRRYHDRKYSEEGVDRAGTREATLAVQIGNIHNIRHIIIVTLRYQNASAYHRAATI